ncbi:MAG: hypothetical protein QOJ59_5639, partial [Thermomicrobiales bacterium]|nr:hypothetical protein [Thermomicrobiales bacterium]
MASALDRDSEGSLVLGTGAELAPRFDLATFGEVTSDVAEILVIDFADVVGAEGAN